MFERASYLATEAVEAGRVDDEAGLELAAAWASAEGCTVFRDESWEGQVPTESPWVYLKIGLWLVRHADGHFSSYDDGVFAARYRPAAADEGLVPEFLGLFRARRMFAALVGARDDFALDVPEAEWERFGELAEQLRLVAGSKT